MTEASVRRWTLHVRSLRHYWRVHLATLLCTAAATVALAGSLMVGDSMRGSLRDQALRRLGPVEYALIAPRFFRQELADELAAQNEFRERFGSACPAILARGAVEHADSGRRVSRVSLLGTEDRFRSAAGLPSDETGPQDRAIVNEALARRLDVREGQDVLIRLGAQQSVPVETLLGRADEATVSLRVTVGRIVSDLGAGGMDLGLSADEPLNLFVPLETLQRAMKRRLRVNAILVTARSSNEGPPGDAATLQAMLKARVGMSDLGLRLRRDNMGRAIVLESETLLLEPPVESAAIAAAGKVNARITGVFTYLANSIAPAAPETQATPPGAPPAPSIEIPYSTVSAIAPVEATPPAPLTLTTGEPAPALGDDELFVNAWAAEELKLAPGDSARLTYYVTDAFRQLRTESHVFTVRGVVAMRGLAVDKTLAPEYEGVTNAKRISDWEPPFPMDMKRIRDRDELYWERYGPVPKAFVSLAGGQRLWAERQGRFGRLTSMRLSAAEGGDMPALTMGFERHLRESLPPEAVGLRFESLRSRALEAAGGSTDFGMLFLGFSFFLIAAAVLLIVLVFRLGVERRAGEVGLLLAIGFPGRAVRRNLLLEALWPAGLGAALGLWGAAFYADAMLSGLERWWSGTIRADFLQLHVQAGSLLAGGAVSLLLALLSIAWSLRVLKRASPRALLAGAGRWSTGQAGGSRRLPAAIGLSFGAAALGLAGLSMNRSVPPAAAFFGSGAALLVASLAVLQVWARRPLRAALTTGGRAGIARLGMRNAARHSTRSMLTAGLIASATFVITAVGANRRSIDDAGARSSGTGGFALLAETSVPILHDLNSSEGRRAAGLTDADDAPLAGSTITPFRLRPGDEASCLSLYRPVEPRLLGATQAMIERGGFTFKDSLAESPAERANPWLLLHRTWADGAVPVIGDDSTVTWLLHLRLGDDLVVTDDRGRPAHLRLVGLLSGSVLQSELVLAESRFVEHFPSISGYGFFLAEAPAERADALRAGLESGLRRYGLEAIPTSERLARYHRVENAYISAFQALGGIGMVLGTLGLGAVLARNVLERRGELALLRALGFRVSELRWMLLAEHLLVLSWGLAAGVFSGLLASGPQLAGHPHGIPWASIALTLAGVLLAGTLAGGAALWPTLRTPLLGALRDE